MIPIVTPEEMNEIDRRAPEPVEVLIERAGAAVARAAVEMLGGAYGRRVSVLAGPGNNGNDGRSAARHLETHGVRVAVVDARSQAPKLPPADLVIDAAFGTGFRGEFHQPELLGRSRTAPVLAVDIPSGIDGLTGSAAGSPIPANRTVTFAALKPGLLLAEGRTHCGEVVVADIGLDTSAARGHLVEPSDLPALVPLRPADSHKWRSAVWVIGGSPGMPGAPFLAARAAMRGGAGYVRVSTPGVDHPHIPVECVSTPLPASGWGREVAEALESDSQRFSAVLVGPGLSGTPEQIFGEIEALTNCEVPLVLDGTALRPPDPGAIPGFQRPPVLTPHEGEFTALTGAPPAADRFASVRDAAARTGSVVLLKGPTTAVADPEGKLLVAASGDQRLATAGSGDVLAGLLAANLARGSDPAEGCAAAAVLHGIAGGLAGPGGVVAEDIAEALPNAANLSL